MPELNTKVITNEVRLSYAHIFEPFSNAEGAKPKYSCALLIPKTDTGTISKIKAAIEAAKQIGKDSKWGGKIPASLTLTVRDGDLEADDKGEAYRGHWFLNVSSMNKPAVVDKDGNEIVVASEVYSGCYARAIINAFPFEQSGNKGVSFGLNAIQKTRDGEPFGNVVTAASAAAEFGSFAGASSGSSDPWGGAAEDPLG